MELPRLLVIDFDHGDAQTAEHIEIRARIAADVREGADDEHRALHATLQQRTRDDEAVSAIVSSAAEHGHPAIEPLFVGGLNRRDHLAAGILHEHERWNPDFFDGVAVSLAHLRGSEDSHSAVGSRPSAVDPTWVKVRSC